MVERALSEYFATPPLPDEEGIFLSPGRVKKIIQRLPRKKAPGLDAISNETLRNLTPRSVVALTRICNGILRSRLFSTCWKTGEVVMIPKPGKNARNPES